MKFIRSFLPMLAVALLLGLLTITVLDGFNPMMKFLNSGTSKIYIAITCVVCLAVAVTQIAEYRREHR